MKIEINNDGFLNYCIEYFGTHKQQIVAIEEMAELTQQLSKFLINHNNRSRDKVVEEFVDVLIMLNQIKLIYLISDEEIDSRVDAKLTRLVKYIQLRKDNGVVE